MIDEERRGAYPTEDHESLAGALNIREGERVLEIGGGGNPFSRADVLVDVDFASGRHRDGVAVCRGGPGQKYLQANVEALPFKNKSFDVVICMHVLEHVDDPGLACEELMRVARRGFLETPRKWTEYYAGHPTHKWLVDEEAGRLVFEPILYDSSPFLNFALASLWKSPELVLRARTLYPHIPCVQKTWEGRFSYEIRGELPIRSGANDRSAGLRHYHFARNLLRWAAPPQRGLFHAACALEPAPGDRACRHLHLLYCVLCEKLPLPRRGFHSFRHLLLALCASLLLKLSRRFETWYQQMIMQFLQDSGAEKEENPNHGG